MRSFIFSALVIASFLVGQQWFTKSSEAQSVFHTPLEWAAHSGAATTRG